MSETLRDELRAACAALDLDLPDETLARVAHFGALVLRWTRRANLVSAQTDERTLVERHLLDSLALLRVLDDLDGTVMDVGAGAGFPSLPVWIARPGANLTILEPSAKRVTFLRAAVRELALQGVAVRAARLEDLGDTERFDLLLSRATFAPGEWLRRATPLLVPGGRVVAMLGRDSVDAVAEEGAALGLALLRADPFVLPWSRAQRANLVLAAPLA